MARTGCYPFISKLDNAPSIHRVILFVIGVAPQTLKNIESNCGEAEVLLQTASSTAKPISALFLFLLSLYSLSSTVQIKFHQNTMPLCTLHLIALSTDLPTFLTTLRKTTPQPLLISRVIRWVIKPTILSVNPLLTQTSPPWTLLLIYPDTTGLPSSLQSSVAAIYTLQIGVPSRILSAFPATNAKLLSPKKEDVPPLTGALKKPRLASSAQNLELTDELRGWINEYDPDQAKGAVSMLNFLAFNPDMHSEYLKYGKAFAESIGSRRGGNAKIVGKVVGKEDGGWEEVAVAHYPSIWHFADMAGSEDYQAVNKEHRVGSLRDTCILMTSELGLPDAGSVEGKAKL